MATVEQVQTMISELSDADRKKVLDYYYDNYCGECGAYTGCDCPECVCVCRRRRAQLFWSLFDKLTNEHPDLTREQVYEKACNEFKG